MWPLYNKWYCEGVLVVAYLVRLLLMKLCLIALNEGCNQTVHWGGWIDVVVYFFSKNFDFPFYGSIFAVVKR